MSNPISRALRKTTPLEILCGGAVVLYLGLFILYPYGHVLVYSFWEKDLYTIRPAFSFENYQRIFERTLYTQVVTNSLQVAATVTAISGLVGYLLAYQLARYAGRWKYVLFVLLIVPLWTSFLLRAYIWKIILGRNGIISGALTQLGMRPENLDFLLYSRFSISIALIYIFIPFVALPVFAAVEKLPPSYMEASADLGARPTWTFWFITFPLTVPALLAGSTIVFCLSFGDFIAPALLGGTEDIMITNVIIGQFGAAFDWPFGSALAIVVLATVIVAVSSTAWLAQRVVGGRT